MRFHSRIFFMVVLLVVCLGIKKSWESNQADNCIQYPNICKAHETCVASGDEKYFACEPNKEKIQLRKHLIKSYEDGQNSKYYEYDITLINNSNNEIKELRLCVDDAALNLKDVKAIWDIDRFPNGDLILPMGKHISPGSLYKFGFVARSELSESKFRVKSIVI
ncbi:hypothetical protein CYY_006657 [Polysphondylium violaceum]|uniref:Carbohydrate binding domain-containing protein n=1 Tax=Polysphondylium violaceum TaxID=133409 RepID=A0A8J4PR08_9MYCE|nr:hypothetical protein CYY_006657 [Polysphondylium violaceum]